MTTVDPGQAPPASEIFDMVSEQLAQVRMQDAHIAWALSRAHWTLVEAGQFIKDVATMVRLDQAT